MSLSPGTRIASYEIVAALGAGAMGEVFRARDTNLGRDVAIKVLPEEFAQDEERLQRFEREARLVAQLNHPGIAGVYGLESEDDMRFIVMEFVDGETLGTRIARGPIRWRDALAVAVQVADALDAAHEAGIVHRDLKPDNVGVTAGDTAKLLDFGIGKPMNEELQRAIGSSQQMTQAGAILGTPTYICPEQFKGKPVDRRADIWAFGCLLYEMLTGAPAFSGETVGEIAAAVLNADPDWSALPDDVPAALTRLIRDCLQKDPRERLRDIGEARRVLTHVDDVDVAAPTTTTPPDANQRSWWWAVVLLCLATVLGLNANTWFGPASDSGRDQSKAGAPVTGDSPPAERVVFQIPLPDGYAVRHLFAAPGGDALGMVLRDIETGDRAIWVRRIADPELRKIDGTNGAGLANFAPDGQAIAFHSQSSLSTVDLRTGAVEQLSRGLNLRGVPCWLPDGRILLSPSYDTALSYFSATDPEADVVPATVLAPGRDRGHRDSTPIGDGATFLARILPIPTRDPSAVERRPELVFFRAGEPGTEVGRTGIHSLTPGWAIGEHIVYGDGERLLHRPFDAATGKAGGEPGVVAAGVGILCSASAGGLVAFQPGNSQVGQTVPTWLDAAPNGPVEEVGLAPDAFGEMAVSPDGGRIVTDLTNPSSEVNDLYVFEDGHRRRLTYGENTVSAVWSPDGTKVAYLGLLADDGTWTHGVYWREADGSGERVHVSAGGSVSDWSPTGWLIHSIGGGAGIRARWMGEIGCATPPSTPGVRSHDFGDATTSCARLSHDGRWIAYCEGPRDAHAVWVRGFGDELGRPFRVSPPGGHQPAWSPTSLELVYSDGSPTRRGGPNVMRVRFEEPSPGDDALTALEPELLHEFPHRQFNRGLEWSADGQRILAVPPPQPSTEPITVIAGWAAPNE